MPVRVLQSNGQLQDNPEAVRSSRTEPGCGGCGKGSQSDPATASPVQRDRWPKWAAVVEGLSHPGEVGVGDTVHRLATVVGGEIFRRVMAAIGVPCGCDQRQELWNKTFPYGSINLIAGKTL